MTVAVSTPRRLTLPIQLSRETERCKHCDAVSENRTELARLDNSVVRRIQMPSTFIDVHYTFGGERQHEYPEDMFFPSMTRIDVSASPLLRAAVDAVGCAHLGQAGNNPSLVHRARSAYGSLLQSLKNVVHLGNESHSNSSFNDREVLTSLMMLAVRI